MDGWLEYNTDLFERDSIERVIRRFRDGARGSGG